METMIIMQNPQAAIETHLRSGHSITVLEAIDRFHTTELRRIISRLRAEGMEIIGTWYESNKKRYKRYFWAGL